MKTLHDSAALKSIIERIHALEVDDLPIWGKMSVSEMVAHLGDQLKVAMGDIQTAKGGGFFTRNVMIHLVLWGMPAPKGKVKTFKEIDHALGNGTKPLDFETSKDKLLKEIDRFLAFTKDNDCVPHSVFGNLSNKQWSRLAYIHMDHHLKQFGA